MKCTFFIVLTFSVHIVFGQETKLDTYKKWFDTDLEKWTASFENFNLSEFKREDSVVRFENNQPLKFKTLKPFLDIYKPILTYSKDSSSFIDIYSYQLNLKKEGDQYFPTRDIDQVIYLCNKKTKYWNRILFFSTYSSWIDEAIWVSTEKFILTGSRKNEIYANAPVIYIGDTIKKTFEVFGNTNKNCIENGYGYTSEKLKRIEIIDPVQGEN
ncbi:hypothetical protein ACQ33O_03360 [Ferruginibacter sp. SUN002]|uniref:hypothetical protein n=1 Tax=Ferruginibacter sp. SUN002 TaxID=2937789 RepID=UPI003D35DB91